jgi:D-glycero-alpha-D-manno-heptose-7-phosphate kinase
MITTRTPLRISFAGGGSDLPSFFSEEPGMVLSAAINKYIYLTVKKAFNDMYRVSYSRTEIQDTARQIEHPIVRECLRMVRAPRGLEIVSIADIPARTGMGSSSSFTVGLLGALYAMTGQFAPASKLAAGACDVEIERLGEPIGKQDQYIAAYGGLQFIQFQPTGEVFVDPVICPPNIRLELSRRLTLLYTGTTRDAGSVLAKQSKRAAINRASLRDLCAIAREMRDVLTQERDLNQFGRLLHSAWEVKKGLEDSISNPELDAWYERGRAAGAIGGKLLGAGGGGFLLFYCEPQFQSRLLSALPELMHVPFDFEPQGSKVIYVGDDHWQDRASFSTATE